MTRVSTYGSVSSGIRQGLTRESERGDKEARSGIRNPTWPRGWPRSFRYRSGETNRDERTTCPWGGQGRSGGGCGPKYTRTADSHQRNRCSAFARSTDHHLRRWPSYFRRARQCHVAKQDRIPISVYPWTTESSSDQFQSPLFSKFFLLRILSLRTLLFSLYSLISTFLQIHASSSLILTRADFNNFSILSAAILRSIDNEIFTRRPIYAKKIPLKFIQILLLSQNHYHRFYRLGVFRVCSNRSSTLLIQFFTISREKIKEIKDVYAKKKEGRHGR